MIPLPQTLIAKVGIFAALALAIFLCGLFYGKSIETKKEATRIVKEQVVQVEKNQESSQATVKVVTVYKDRIVEVEKLKPVIKREIHEVFKDAPSCNIPAGFVGLHNSVTDTHNHATSSRSTP